MTARVANVLRWMILVLMLILPGARAELRVMIDSEHSTCLQYEQMNIMLFLLNETHHPITIGSSTNNEQSELSFLIERGEDVWVKRTPAKALRPITLAPGEERSMVIPLSDWYDMTDEGSYRVQAMVKVGERRYVSPLLGFSVVPGIELTAESKLVPGVDNVLRKYRVMYWKRGLYEYVFLRVDEPSSGDNYGVFELGRLVRFGKLELHVSMQGDVVVRHQSAPECFIRTRFRAEPDGVRFVDQTYELSDGSPYPVSGKRLRVQVPRSSGK